MDGAFFNSGQSCCGIERVYVHESIYDSFVAAFAKQVEGYVLGDPMNPETTLGPMVRPQNADHARRHIQAAIAAGAQALIDPSTFPADKTGTAYLAPQVLVNVDHSMAIMREETFGPVVGIMSVKSDDEAIRLMNDSDFGLTASIWTSDEDAAMRIAEQLETGTVFMNRCDYLDPELAWVGVKNSGRGCTLSKVGFEQLTDPNPFTFDAFDFWSTPAMITSWDHPTSVRFGAGAIAEPSGGLQKPWNAESLAGHRRHAGQA